MKIALAGNPNSGKSTLFNALTGLNQSVGNYPGITVDKKLGNCTLDRSTKAQIIDLPGAVAAVTSNPAEILKLDVGQLSVGAKADICIFDPNQKWKVDATNLHSNGTNTPFDKQLLPGVVRYTLISGKVVFENLDKNSS